MPCIERIANTVPVSLNGNELKSSKQLQTGDLIELAGKTFKWESQLPNATKTPGRVVKKSLVPKITRRRSLSDFRAVGRKSIRQSFGHLRTWEETNEDESTKTLSSPNKSCSSSPTKPVVASKGSTRQSEILISDTPMKPSEPNKTEEFYNSSKRKSTRKSLKPKVSEKTPKTKKSPAQMHSAGGIDKKPVSAAEKRSKSATKLSKIPTKKYSESQKIQRANMKFFGTPLKFSPVSKIRKFTSPDKSSKVTAKTPKQSQKTPKTPAKTPNMSSKTPKTPKSKLVKTPRSASSKTPSNSSKTPISSSSKTPKTTKSTSKTLKSASKGQPRISLNKITKTPNSTSKLLKTNQNSPREKLKLTKSASKIEKLTLKTPSKMTKTPRSVKKLIKTPKSAEKLIEIFNTANELVKTPITVEKTVKTPKSAAKLPKTPKSAEKLPKTPKSIEKPVKIPKSTEKLASASKSEEQLVKPPRSSEKSVKTPRSASISPGKLKTPRSSIRKIGTPKSLQILKSSTSKRRMSRKSLDIMPINAKNKSPEKLLSTPVNIPAVLVVQSSQAKNTPTPRKSIKLKVSPKIKIKLISPKKSPDKKNTPKSSKKTPKSVLTESNKTPDSNKKSARKIKTLAIKENITPPDSGSTSPDNGVKTPENFMLKPLATPESIKAVKSAMKKDASLRKSLSTQGHSKKRKLSDIAGDGMASKKIKLSSPLIIDGNVEYTPTSPRTKSNKAFSEPRPVLNRDNKTNLPSTVGRITMSHRSTPRAIWTNQRVSTDTPTLHLEEELVEYSPVSKNQEDNVRNLSFNEQDLSGIEKISNDSDLNIIETSPKQSNTLNLSHRSTRSQKFNDSNVPLIDFTSPGPSKTSTVTKKKKSVSLIDFTSSNIRKNTRLSKSAQSAKKNISVISVEVHTPEPLSISRSRKSSQRTPVQFHTILSDKYENITPEPNTPTRATRFSSQPNPNNNSSMFVQYDDQSIAQSINSTKISRSSKKFNNSRNSSQENVFDESQTDKYITSLNSRKSLSKSTANESPIIIEETKIDSPNKSKSKRQSQIISDLESPTKSQSKRTSRLSKNKTSDSILDSSLDLLVISPEKLPDTINKNISKTVSRNSSQITTSSDMSPLNLSESSPLHKLRQKSNTSINNTLNNSSTSRKSSKSLNAVDKTNSSFDHTAAGTLKENVSIRSTRSQTNDTIEIISPNASVGLRSSSKQTKSPVNDLSNVSNIKNLFDAEMSNTDLTKAVGIKSLFNTAKVKKSPLNDLSDVRGVRNMYRTPGRKVHSPKNDLTDVTGVKKLLEPEKSPRNDLTDVKGLKNIFRTPKRQHSPENDLTDVQGVKKLLKTPRLQETMPKNDLTNVRGVKELIRGYRNSPRNDLTDVRGIKSLFKKKQKSPKNDLTNVAGVKKIMRTPRQTSSPVNDLTNVSGVQQLFKVAGSPKNDLEDVRGVKRLFGEASTKNSYLNVSDMNTLFDELKNNAEDDSFKIIEKLHNSPVRTYERKAKSVSPQKEEKTHNNRLSVNSNKKPAEISKWIEEQKNLINKKSRRKTKEDLIDKTPIVELNVSKSTPRESRRKQKVTQNTPVTNEIIEVNTRSKREKLIEKLVSDVIKSVEETPQNLQKDKNMKKHDIDTPNEKRNHKQVIQDEVVNSTTKTRGRKRESAKEDVETPKEKITKSLRSKKNVTEETPKVPVVDSTVNVDTPASTRRRLRKDLQEEIKESPRATQSRRAKVNVVENSTRGKRVKEQMKKNEKNNDVATPVVEQEILTSVTIKQTTRRLKGVKNNFMTDTVEILEVLDTERANDTDKQVKFDIPDDEKNKKRKTTKTTDKGTKKTTRSTRSRSESDADTTETKKGRAKKGQKEEPKVETPVRKRTRTNKTDLEPVVEIEDLQEKQATPVQKRTRNGRFKKNPENEEETTASAQKGPATRSKKTTSVKDSEEEVQETETKKTRGKKRETKKTEEKVEKPVKRSKSTRNKPQENEDEPKEVKDSKRKNTRSKAKEQIEEEVEEKPKTRGRKAQTTKTNQTTEDTPVTETKSRRRKIAVEEQKPVKSKKQKVEETPTRVTRARRK